MHSSLILEPLCVYLIADGQSSGVNKEGIAYYNNLIDGLLKKGAFQNITILGFNRKSTYYVLV